MNGSIPRTQIPEGVRDRLPREAARVRKLIYSLEGVFRSWGYREIQTPTFEYLETVTAGAGMLGRREDLYQFFDRKGRTLALRADMTTPIARLVCTKLMAEPMPLRLSYFGPVFRRRVTKAGSANEIWQAGTELIGASGTGADAEVVAMACAALSVAGLTRFQVGIGHVDFVEGIFAEVSVPSEQETQLRAALADRDLVTFEKGVAQAAVSPEHEALLLAMATFQGSFAEARVRFGGVRNDRVARALQQLEMTFLLLAEMGVADQVSLDLGLTNSMGYYTGVLFEGYAPGVGAPVMAGGRYDNLLADFGGDAPATGFALEMDRMLAALERQTPLGVSHGTDLIVQCLPGQEAEAMAKARELRAQGLAVEVDLLGRTGDDLSAYAEQRGARRVVTVEGVVVMRPSVAPPGPTKVEPIH